MVSQAVDEKLVIQRDKEIIHVLETTVELMVIVEANVRHLDGLIIVHLWLNLHDDIFRRL